MPITDLLERNSKLYGEEVALVEINPEIREEQRVTWKEYELIQPTSTSYYRVYCSGAAYPLVRAVYVLSLQCSGEYSSAIPKSISFTKPFSSMMILDGLKSL